VPEITPEVVLEALLKRPALLLEVKALVNHAKVAGPWTDYYTSKHAKALRSYGHWSVRFTPEPYECGASRAPTTTIVVTVWKEHKPSEPVDWDGNWDWEEQEEAEREHREVVARWENSPWKWTLKRHGKSKETCGYAATEVDAKVAADEALRRKGWVLVGNSDDPDIVEGEAPC